MITSIKDIYYMSEWNETHKDFVLDMLPLRNKNYTIRLRTHLPMIPEILNEKDESYLSIYREFSTSSFLYD